MSVVHCGSLLIFLCFPPIWFPFPFVQGLVFLLQTRSGWSWDGKLPEPTSLGRAALPAPPCQPRQHSILGQDLDLPVAKSLGSDLQPETPWGQSQRGSG